MSVIEIFTSIILAYLALGALYTLRLSWDSIAARFSGLFALLCVLALWPLVFWAEAGHAVRERRCHRRTYRIPSEEYQAAVARLSAERRSRGNYHATK